MPSPGEAYLYDTAVLWEATGQFDRHGNPVVGDPVELNPQAGNGVKWNSKRTKSTDPKGNAIMLDGTAVVNQDIPVGSRMWLGRLIDFYETGSADAEFDDELMEVKMFNAVFDLKGRESTKVCGLMRWKQRGA